MPGQTRIEPGSGHVRPGQGQAGQERAFPGEPSPGHFSLGHLGSVVKVLPRQGQVHPGLGPDRSKKAQPRPARACLGQHMAGLVRSGPYRIWTCSGKSQNYVTPGQVTARHYKNELAYPHWASLNQLR